MNQSAANKRIQFWIGIAVSVVCLAALFVFIRPGDILEAIRNSRYEFWLLTAISLLLFMIIRAVRWRLMINRGFGENVIAYNNVFHVQNIGYMLTNILPFRLGDVARAVLIGNIPPITISLGISTMVVERLFDLLFIIILFPFTIAAVEQVPQTVKSIALITGGLAIMATLVIIGAANRRQVAMAIAESLAEHIRFINTDPWLRRLDDGLKGLGIFTNFRDALTLAIISVVVWLPIVLGYYAGMLAVNLTPSLIEAAFVVCIAAFSVTAPSSPGQIGVFEASVTFAIATLLGMPKPQAASFALLYHAVNYVVIGLLGIIGISRTGETFGSVIASAKSIIQSGAD